VPTDQRLVAAARTAGVHCERVLAAIAAVPRELFIPTESMPRAQQDVPIPIPHGLVTTQPSLVAVMVDALELTGTETVLEIGTGYGYQTALLAHLARHVYSIEWWPDLAAAAVENLIRAGVGNASVEVGDGGDGLPAHGPYEAIVVSAAARTIPPPLINQLVEGGHLVAPIGAGGDEWVRLFGKRSGALVAARDLVPARFVILAGRYGA
jgi:protein-L-isoaspartate(D-aspartate) O-methyltransferase